MFNPTHITSNWASSRFGFMLSPVNNRLTFGQIFFLKMSALV